MGGVGLSKSRKVNAYYTYGKIANKYVYMPALYELFKRVLAFG